MLSAFQHSYQKRETKITKSFRSGIINLLFDGIPYNTGRYFAHCSYFSSPLRGLGKILRNLQNSQLASRDTSDQHFYVITGHKVQLVAYKTRDNMTFITSKALYQFAMGSNSVLLVYHKANLSLKLDPGTYILSLDRVWNWL